MSEQRKNLSGKIETNKKNQIWKNLELKNTLFETKKFTLRA